jgi:hypothetical protein
MTVGTVAYMSPEQVGGEVLDRRTDLFSLGVVLYECVTNRQPFQGKTSAVILASILHQQPTPPITLNANVPLGLQDVIHKSLEKGSRAPVSGCRGVACRPQARQAGFGVHARFRSARTGLADALAAGCGGAERRGRQSSARRTGSSASAPVPVARQRGLLVAVGAAAALVIGCRRRARLVRTGSAAAPDASSRQTAQVFASVPGRQPPRRRHRRRSMMSRVDVPMRPPRSSMRQSSRAIASWAVGNADGATRAAERRARSNRSAVASRSRISRARIVEFYKSAASRRPVTEPARGASAFRGISANFSASASVTAADPGAPPGRLNRRSGGAPPSPPPAAPRGACSRSVGSHRTAAREPRFRRGPSRSSDGPAPAAAPAPQAEDDERDDPAG